MKKYFNFIFKWINFKRKKYLLELQHNLVNLPLCYGIKSPDMFFYDFGFGEIFKTVDLYGGKDREIPTFALHVCCAFEVIWKDKSKHSDIFSNDTPCDKFNAVMERLIGIPIKRVSLSEKYDLWLDLGVCWIVFATNEDKEESWRFFSPNNRERHLVASNKKLKKQ
ncbi:MAG: hypothetical protein E7480_04340 [Ruminococcaceae bacterium]|nr:hypothetical protein [Oscillospiraceae bacterium]